MNNEQFNEMVKQMIEEESAVGKSKGVEYVVNDDRLDNFKRIGAETKCPHCKKPLGAKIVWWIYFKKHIDSILSFIKRGKVLSEESIEGRIMDSRVYLSLLRGIIQEERDNVSIVSSTFPGTSESTCVE